MSKKVKSNVCKNCNGTGGVPFEDVEIQSCPICNGSGRSDLKKELPAVVKKEA